MSTRSFIGKKFGNAYIGVYCHFDGYLEGVGATLVESYTNEKAVEELISGGSISVLGATCKSKEGHSFEHQLEGLTVYYNRDRGEEWENTKPSIYNCKKDMFDNGWLDYFYIFEDGKWKYATGSSHRFRLVPTVEL